MVYLFIFSIVFTAAAFLQLISLNKGLQGQINDLKKYAESTQEQLHKIKHVPLQRGCEQVSNLKSAGDGDWSHEDLSFAKNKGKPETTNPVEEG